MIIVLAQVIHYTIQIYVLLIIMRAVLSFFPQLDRGHPVVRFLDQVVDPVMRPFQRLLPPMAGMDFSPILAILTLQMVEQITINLLMGLRSGVF